MGKLKKTQRKKTIPVTVMGSTTLMTLEIYVQTIIPVMNATGTAAIAAVKHLSFTCRWSGT